jgi:hypothetical protein
VEETNKALPLAVPSPPTLRGRGCPGRGGRGGCEALCQGFKVTGAFAPHGTTPSPGPAGPPSPAKRGRERQAAVLRLERFFLHFGLHPLLEGGISHPGGGCRRPCPETGFRGRDEIRPADDACPAPLNERRDLSRFPAQPEPLCQSRSAKERKNLIRIFHPE